MEGKSIRIKCRTLGKTVAVMSNYSQKIDQEVVPNIK